MASFIPDMDGRNFVTLKNDDGSSVVVYEQGAHIVSWKNSKEEEMLYFSPDAVKKDRVALRGGVPVIFPQFGNRGPLNPSHGFARLRPWKLKDVDNGRGVFTLYAGIDELTADNSNFSSSPKNAVLVEYTITFDSENMTLSATVKNLSEETAASFHFCFHTYFAVDDVEKAVINGFNRSPFYDQLTKINGRNDSMKLQKPELHWAIKGGKEVDRIFPNQACAIMLQQPHKDYMLYIAGTQMPDVVLWNPGEEKCKKSNGSFKDLPEDAYKHFICVEHGSIMRRVTVQPAATWTGAQTIRAMKCTPVESKI